MKWTDLHLRWNPFWNAVCQWWDKNYLICSSTTHTKVALVLTGVESEKQPHAQHASLALYDVLLTQTVTAHSILHLKTEAEELGSIN